VRQFLAYVLEQSENPAGETAALGESPFDTPEDWNQGIESYATDLAVEDLQEPEAHFLASEPPRPRNSVLNSFWESVKNCVENLTASENETESDPLAIQSVEPPEAKYTRTPKREMVQVPVQRAEYE